jgi:hypothetical protein
VSVYLEKNDLVKLSSTFDQIFNDFLIENTIQCGDINSIKVNRSEYSENWDDEREFIPLRSEIWYIGNSKETYEFDYNWKGDSNLQEEEEKLIFNANLIAENEIRSREKIRIFMKIGKSKPIKMKRS